jgi:hypothetical protein
MRATSDAGAIAVGRGRARRLIALLPARHRVWPRLQADERLCQLSLQRRPARDNRATRDPPSCRGPADQVLVDNRPG